ncbi:MAG TPA: 2-amino-4-hydroxy-6-hydroxymethyldihydropteridine diphosphokinase [Crocinitomicaceae bacterium]|nr:2-amino-4-hydroxy-6-hydroxymethyldihydropteridine diphosphokinase [Crocinitomicaceae bacterium]
MTFNNSKKNVYIALGSNLGDRLKNIEKAYGLITLELGEIFKKSSVYESKAQGYSSENNYYNSVILCQTEKTPENVLEILLNIEKKLGRKRTSSDYQDRPIDLDLLIYDTFAFKMFTPHLELPHPRIFERSFVVVPLLEIAEDEVLEQVKSFEYSVQIEDGIEKLSCLD